MIINNLSLISSSVSLDLAADIKLSDKLDEATITPNETIDLIAVDKPILNKTIKCGSSFSRTLKLEHKSLVVQFQQNTQVGTQELGCPVSAEHSSWNTRAWLRMGVG